MATAPWETTPNNNVTPAPISPTEPDVEPSIDQPVVEPTEPAVEPSIDQPVVEPTEPAVEPSIDQPVVEPTEPAVEPSTDPSTVEPTEPAEQRKQRKQRKPKPPKEPKEPKEREQREPKQSRRSKLKNRSGDNLSFVAVLKRVTTRTQREPEQTRRNQTTAAPTGGVLKRGKIVCVDDCYVTEVTMRHHQPVAVETVKFDTPEEAIAAAGKAKHVVIAWSNLVGVSSTHKQTPNKMLTRLSDAITIESLREPDSVGTRIGDFVAGANAPELKTLVRKTNVYVSAAAVDLNAAENAYWLRVGETFSELTRVEGGVVRDHGPLFEFGLKQVEDAIREGKDPSRSLAEQAKGLSAAVARLRNDWMAKAGGASVIYLHGPGSDWTNIREELRSTTTCRIDIPRVLLEAKDGDLVGGDLSHLATAVLATASQPLYSTRSVFRRVSFVDTATRWVPRVIAVAVVAFSFWTWRTQSSDLDSRVVTAETNTVQIQALIEANQETSSDAVEALQALLNDLDDDDTWRWQQHADETMLRFDGTAGLVLQRPADGPAVLEPVAVDNPVVEPVDGDVLPWTLARCQAASATVQVGPFGDDAVAADLMDQQARRLFATVPLDTTEPVPTATPTATLTDPDQDPAWDEHGSRWLTFDLSPAADECGAGQ